MKLTSSERKRVGMWGDAKGDEEAEVMDSKFPKTVRCGDCKKRVRWDVAHGEAVEHSGAADSRGV